MNITVLPYIDETLMEQQKDSIANAKKQEVLDQFENVLQAASTAIEAVTQKIQPTSTSVDTSSGNTTSTAASNSLGCPDELDAYFQKASATYGVDVNLLKSIAKAESSFQADAVSKAGAMGIRQRMPTTASDLGVTDAYNAEQNIMGGSKYIAQLLEQYSGDTSLALAAYNAGSNNVDKYGGIPPFTETQNYVKKVLSYYDSASADAQNSTAAADGTTATGSDTSANSSLAYEESAAEIQEELNQVLADTFSRMNVTKSSLEEMIEVLKQVQTK